MSEHLKTICRHTSTQSWQMRSLFHGSTHPQSWNSLPSSFQNKSALICYKKTSYHEYLSSMHPCHSQAWWTRKLHRNNENQSISVHPHGRKGSNFHHLAWNIKQYKQHQILFKNKTPVSRPGPIVSQLGVKSKSLALNLVNFFVRF